mmetsp:Transcript_10262/g.20700  ORF Transcript_10262/g.20700 Transcript_10262/m.20700 type:complete len:92 (+) Transcript_10262:81-356(+)
MMTTTDVLVAIGSRGDGSMTRYQHYIKRPGHLDLGVKIPHSSGDYPEPPSIFLTTIGGSPRSLTIISSFSTISVLTEVIAASQFVQRGHLH